MDCLFHDQFIGHDAFKGPYFSSAGRAGWWLRGPQARRQEYAVGQRVIDLRLPFVLKEKFLTAQAHSSYVSLWACQSSVRILYRRSQKTPKVQPRTTLSTNTDNSVVTRAGQNPCTSRFPFKFACHPCTLVIFFFFSLSTYSLDSLQNWLHASY